MLRDRGRSGAARPSAPASRSPCDARTRTPGNGAARSSRSRSRYTFATIEAAAIEAQSASPWIDGKLRPPDPGHRDGVADQDLGLRARSASTAIRMAGEARAQDVADVDLARADDSDAERRSRAGGPRASSRSRAAASSFLESSRPGRTQSSGRMTAAATTGPASEPAARLVHAGDEAIAAAAQLPLEAVEEREAAELREESGERIGVQGRGRGSRRLARFWSRFSSMRAALPLRSRR